MLEGLTSLDLSGITGKVNITYDNTIYVVPAIIMAVLLFIIVTWIFSNIFGKTKTGNYREVMVDMYVVGMIKKFATEDNVNILSELKEYNLMQKKSDFKMNGLNSAIESHLSEKVADKTFDKLDKK